MTVTFHDQLNATFEACGTRPAILHRGRPFTYAEVAQQARRIAGRLQRLGLVPGERVALPLGDKLPCVLAGLGVQFAGGVALPLNPRLPAGELRYFLEDSGASFAIADPEQISQLERAQADLPALRHVLSADPDGETSALDHRPVSPGPDDPCLIVYSSGTTGWPKGIVHGQANLASALLALRNAWRLTPEDRIVNVLPLFHVHGLCFATQMPLLTGSCIVLEDSFDPERTLDAIGSGTVFMAVPTIWYRLLEVPEFRDRARQWKDARLFTCGSAPIRPEVLPELEAILGRPIINRYGMTEAHVITSQPLDGPWPAGSVGLPLEGVEVEVRREDGSLTSPGEVGSVWIRGPNLFGAYWNRAEATRDAFVAGWFETGDLGTQDDAGFLTLVARKHDLIITSGFNVYPAVVERVLADCPGVRESAVVGLPDARKGERVAAFIVRDDPTLDEVRVTSHCRERLVEYQQPRVITFVESLPRNAMGKVLRRELREGSGNTG